MSTLEQPSDILKETVISIADAAKLLPATNGATVWRWVNLGIMLPDGSARIYLEHVRVGGRTLTSTEAVFRFVNRQTEMFAAQQAERKHKPKEVQPAKVKRGRKRLQMA